MSDCCTCRYAIIDYEEYYGTHQIAIDPVSSVAGFCIGAFAITILLGLFSR